MQSRARWPFYMTRQENASYRTEPPSRGVQGNGSVCFSARAETNCLDAQHCFVPSDFDLSIQTWRPVKVQTPWNSSIEDSSPRQEFDYL